MYEQQGIRCYQETDVASMGKEKMIALLYEKMISCYQRAEQALEHALTAEDQITATERINLAQQIVTELRNALDHEIGGDISRNLEALYDFVFHENLNFLVDRDPQHLRNCIRILTPLLEAWRSIEPGTAEKAMRQLETAADGPNPASPTPEDGDRNQSRADDSSASRPDTDTSSASEAEPRHPQLSLSA